MRILKLDNVTKKDILENLLKRSPSQYKEYQESVDIILDDVLAHGDEALIRLTEKFDRVKLSAGDLKVSEDEINRFVRVLSRPEMMECFSDSASLP